MKERGVAGAESEAGGLNVLQTREGILSGRGSSPAVGLVVAAAIALGAGGCAAPTVRLDDVRVTNVGTESISAVLEFTLKNPNAVSLDVWGLEYSMSAAGTRFAQGSLGGGMQIDCQRIGRLMVPVDLEYERIAKLWKPSDPSGSIPYDFTGELDFRIFGIPRKTPIRHSGLLPRLRAPSWSFRGARLTGGDILELVFDVANPNDFDLPLGSLSGALKYDGRTLIEVERSSLPVVASRQQAELVIPIRIGSAALATIAPAPTRVVEAERFSFAGDLKFGVPRGLREILLGVGGGP